MPICKECAQHMFVKEPSMPPAALANDKMIYDSPTESYNDNVTVMEMLCASFCITSMLCVTLAKKYRGHLAMDEPAHANKHRMASRGNATSFPLPWQDLSQQLHEGDAMEELGKVYLYLEQAKNSLI